LKEYLERKRDIEKMKYDSLSDYEKEQLKLKAEYNDKC
jgi:hypothetical protein